MNMESKLTKQQIRNILNGKKFEMSGYDDAIGGRNENRGQRGSCVLHNQNIINQFASWGIYEYVHYLHVDCYKGTVTVYWTWWNDDRPFKKELDAPTTTEIIQFILDITIYSEGKTRRVKE